MEKAEKRALEVYPKMSRITESHGIIISDYESHYIGDANEEKRRGFIEGYHQAEKDLTLTWVDVKLLQNITDQVFGEVANGKVDFYPSELLFFKEVLNRFNKLKER